MEIMQGTKACQNITLLLNNGGKERQEDPPTSAHMHQKGTSSIVEQSFGV